MSDDVWGFKKKDAEYDEWEDEGKVQVYIISKAKLVPVRLKTKSVTLKEYKQLQNTCDFWINKVRYFEECFKKDKFTTVNGIQFVSLEWLEKEIKEICNEFEKDKYNIYGYERGFDFLLAAAKKVEAGKK